jgi:predicted nucleotide-binding protein
MTKDRARNPNYGIQADTVTAGTIGVGQNVSISQGHVGAMDLPSLRAAISDFQAQVAKYELSVAMRRELEGRVQQISAEGEKIHPDRGYIESTFKALSCKLKVVAASARGGPDLIKSVSKIGSAIGIWSTRRVFIVHGHDEGLREAVARFLERVGLEPIILHEQPNRGRTIMTKFREEAGDTGFAVIVMTPDDIGKANDNSEAKPRARQNVVFELGFFIGALGPDRVAALIKGDIERPSDFDGVLYTSYDKDDWRMKIAQELQAAGYDIDLNKLMFL